MKNPSVKPMNNVPRDENFIPYWWRNQLKRESSATSAGTEMCSECCVQTTGPVQTPPALCVQQGQRSSTAVCDQRVFEYRRGSTASVVWVELAVN